MAMIGEKPAAPLIGEDYLVELGLLPPDNALAASAEQMVQIAPHLLPGAGLVDYMGAGGGPSFGQNVTSGDYADAAWQLLGLGGDLAAAAVPGTTLSRAPMAAERARRAQRALAGDFLPQTWYHGTAGNISAFDPARAGEAQGFALNKRPGIWATRSPAVASHHAEEAARRGAGDAPNVMPLRMNPGRYPVAIDVAGENLSPHSWYANVENAYAHAQAKWGQDPTSVIMKNVPYDLPNGKGVTDMVLVATPQQLRSVVARFQRSKANTGNLLASLVGAGLLVPLSAFEDSRASSSNSTASEWPPVTP